MTATLTAPQATKLTESELASIRAEVDQLIEETIQLDAAIERVGKGTARPLDSQLIDRAKIVRIEDQFNRIAAIRVKQAAAGTPDEYDNAARAHSQAASKLDSVTRANQPKIDQLIAQVKELQSQIDQANAAQEATQAVVAAMDAARDKLRTLAPQVVKDVYARLRTTVGNAVMPRDEVSRLRKLASKANPASYTRDEFARRVAERSPNLSDGKPSFAQLAKQSAEARQKLAEYESRVDALMEQFADLPDLYLPR